MNTYKRHIPELDGIRGIAILLVVMFHLKGFMASFVLLPNWFNIFDPGWCGVDLFFVLSGFLITGILLDTKGSNSYFFNFYMRRVLRIFPVYLIFVGTFFYLEVPWYQAHGHWMDVNRSEQIWYWTYLVNWRDVMYKICQPVSHLWSLSIEEQFYEVWPLILFFTPRKWVKKVIIANIVLSFGALLYFELRHGGGEFLHRLTPFRIGSFAFGDLCAVLYREPWLKRYNKLTVAIGLPALLASAVLIRSSFSVPAATTLLYLSLAVAFGSLVMYCCANSGNNSVVCTFNRLSILRTLGKYSYAMYIIHLTVFRHLVQPAWQYFYERWFLPQWLAIDLTFLTGIAFVYLGGYISWNVLEKHCLRLKKYFDYKWAQRSEFQMAASV